MGVWGWIVLYVLLFSLLQLFVYRYLRSDGDANADHAVFRATPPNAESAGVDEAADFEDFPRNDDPSTVVCPGCGAENEAGYTYCWNCVNPITAR